MKYLTKFLPYYYAMSSVGNLLCKSLYLEGTSCTFKSTILRSLEAEGYPCLAGDFAEHSEKFPYFRRQIAERVPSLLYLAYLFYDFEPYHVIDRTWVANVVYSIVNRVEPEEVEDACNHVLEEIPSEMKAILRKMPVLIVIEGRPEDNHARMVRRDNQIDTNESIDYILKQNTAFTMFAEAFFWPVVKIYPNETNEEFQERCLRQLRSMYDHHIGPQIRSKIRDERSRK